MNIKLFPNEVNVDFYFTPPEIYKSNEDIKLISFNEEGTIVIMATKSNEIRIFDFIGRIILDSSKFFSENEYKIKAFSWGYNSEKLYVTYEKGDLTGYQRIDFDFNNSEKILSIPNNDDNDLSISFQEENCKIIETVFSINKTNGNFELLLSGINPFYLNLTTNQQDYFFIQEKLNKFKYIIIVKKSNQEESFYLFVKELFIFILIKKRENDSLEYDINKSINKGNNHYSYPQSYFLEWLKVSLNPKYIISYVYGLSISCDINSVRLNEMKTLILVNSSDRVLRLFRILDETIILQKENSDNVNKKRWINCFFYTYKIKNGYEDLIITALCDSNSLEFIFIDIDTGKTIKKLEPFKYSVQDFICHYKNHFTLLVISNKKLFNITGIIVKQWGCFAPGLKYIEENIDFIEDETFYDNFEEKTKNIIKQETDNEDKINDCFINDNKPKKNIFFEYIVNKDIEDNEGSEKDKSIKDIKELFVYMGEKLDI